MLEWICQQCRQFPGAVERFPFGPDVLVYSVEQRMFALVGVDRVPPWLNLKCDPNRAIELREQYAAITPGYHMNKRHWITIRLDGSVPLHLVEDLIVHSYRLVVARFPRMRRQWYEAELARRGI